MNKLIYAILAAVLTIFMTHGCKNGSGSLSVDNLGPKVYSGIEPQGDLIVITMDGSNISFDNQTKNTMIGPVHYSRMTSFGENMGFSNLYKTDVVNTSGDYVAFALLNGIGVIYQYQSSAGRPTGNPGYALLKKPIDVNDLKPSSASAPKMYNNIEFQPHPYLPVGNTMPGMVNFGFYFIADNGDGTTGTMSGAVYRMADAARQNYGIDAASIPFGVSNPMTNVGSMSTLTWAECISYIDQVSGTLRIYNNNLGFWETTVCTPSGAQIQDRGPNNGGAFSVPQAASPAYQTAYDGTYLVFGFALNSAGTSNDMKMYKLVLSSGNGNTGACVATDLNTKTVKNFTLAPFAEISSGPGGVDLLGAFKEVSGLNGTSIPANTSNSYLCYGSFLISDYNSGTIVTMDPGGNYLFFMTISGSGTALSYQYGMGIKDPNYSGPPALPSTPPVLSSPIDDSNPIFMNTYFGSIGASIPTPANPQGIHYSMDFVAPTGTAVKASAHGFVSRIIYETKTESDGTVNSYVNVLQEVGGGYTIDYHFEPLLNISIVEGQTLNTGDIIGTMGDNRGMNTRGIKNTGTLDFGFIVPNGNGSNDRVCFIPFVTSDFKNILEIWFNREYSSTADHPGPCNCHYRYPAI